MSLIYNQDFIVETVKNSTIEWVHEFCFFNGDTKDSTDCIQRVSSEDIDTVLDAWRQVMQTGLAYKLPQILYIMNRNRDLFFKFAVKHTEYYRLIKTMLNEAAMEFDPSSSLIEKINELETTIADLQEKIYFQPGGPVAIEAKMDFQQREAEYKNSL
jgi:hypothetical protein